MKRKLSVFLNIVLGLGLASALFGQDEVQPVPDTQVESEHAQTQRLEEEKKAAEQRRERKAREKYEAELKELDAVREARADSTEYTLTPGSVELVVELDPNNYGFRTRNHRSIFGSDFDLVFRGRGMLHYDYRFFEYFGMSLHAGIDWSQVSLYEKFRQDLNRRAPKQFTILGGVSGKWRLSEWYQRSAVFLEPSLLLGHMWQSLPDQKSTHWRLRPGLFGGFETVFDSGLAVTAKLGVEFPIDFAKANAVNQVAEPLLMVGLGFAL